MNQLGLLWQDFGKLQDLKIFLGVGIGKNVDHGQGLTSTRFPTQTFLGPRGPLVLPLVNPPARAKNLDTYIQAYMPHESSGDSSNQPWTV